MRTTGKGLFAMTLAIILVFAIGFSAFAATITITPSETGIIYNAYKVFDVTKSGSTPITYTYTVSGDWKTMVEAWLKTETGKASGMDIADTETATGSGKYSVVVPSTMTDTQTADLAKYLADKSNWTSAAVTFPANADAYGTSTGTSAITLTSNGTSTALDDGFYLITSTLGSVCALATTDISINEKNSLPTIKKTASTTADSTNGASASIGDTVTYTITIEVSSSATGDYVIHDVMSKGLTYSGSLTSVQYQKGTKGDNGYTYGEASTVNASNYSAAVTSSGCTHEDINGNAKAIDGCDFEITISKDYLNTLSDYDRIVITYSATVNENAVSDGDTAPSYVDNMVYLEQKSGTDVDKTSEVKTYNYDFDIVKTNSNGKIISGAKFKIYTQESDGDALKFVKTDTNTYRLAATSDTSTVDEIRATAARIEGLAAGTYYIEESAVPTGYTGLTARTSVTLSSADQLATVTYGYDSAATDATGGSSVGKTTTDIETVAEGDSYTSGGVQVINKSGSVVPSTGGMGTTVFYIIGAILLVGAGVILITRKRMSGQAR